MVTKPHACGSNTLVVDVFILVSYRIFSLIESAILVLLKKIQNTWLIFKIDNFLDFFANYLSSLVTNTFRTTVSPPRRSGFSASLHV